MTETLFVVNHEAAVYALRQTLPREGFTVVTWGAMLAGRRFDTIFVAAFNKLDSETERGMAERYFNEVILTKVRTPNVSPVVIL